MDKKKVIDNKEENLLVENLDETYEGRIYHRSLGVYALAGFLAGGIILGFIAYLISTGSLPVSGFGQFSASGTAPAVTVGFGIGSAVGALAGGIIALNKLNSDR